MNKLFTFGCSYTEDFENVFKSKELNVQSKFVPAQINYVNEFLDGEIPKSWPKLLADLLDYESINYAKGGDSNYGIFEEICINANKFKKDDIVIVGWTHVMRFRWPSKRGWSPCFTNYHNEGDEHLDENTHNKIILARDSGCLVNEIYNYQKIIIYLSEVVGFKLYFWSSCDKIINSESENFLNNEIYLLNEKIISYKKNHLKFQNIFDIVKDNGGLTISNETKEKISDGHLGKIGHEVQAKLFYEHILFR